MLQLLVLLLHCMISQVPIKGHDYSKNMEVNNVIKMLQVGPSLGRFLGFLISTQSYLRNSSSSVWQYTVLVRCVLCAVWMKLGNTVDTQEKCLILYTRVGWLSWEVLVSTNLRWLIKRNTRHNQITLQKLFLYLVTHKHNIQFYVPSLVA